MSDRKALFMFIVPSAIGVILFMIPMKAFGGWTIPVKILSDIINSVIYVFLPIMCIIVLTISAIMGILCWANIGFIRRHPAIREMFSCKPVWAVVRVLGAIFAWLTYLFMGAQEGLLGMIAGGAQGGIALDLICGLVIIFAMASFLLPLLLDFGLLEFIGALLTKFMRPIFKVPGRAAVDCITSWIGDGTLGVMLTCNQYEGGYYSEKEASIIATTFSAVSITFSLVILTQVDLVNYFGIYYLLICLIGIVCAIICPRIPPLSRKKDRYLVPGKAMSETIPKEFNSSFSYGLHLAKEQAKTQNSVSRFFKSGLKNCVKMWFDVLPTVMCIGTVALILANYTPIFEWLGMPFQPLLKVLGVPESAEAASTMVIGFADMFTPSVIISAAAVSAQTRFIVAVVSVTQVLFLDEVGGLILASKLPINIGELFIIFLERTIISLLIICPVSALLF